MSLHKLYLFSKNTEAQATEQGFQYQKLKTLETWLSNRIDKVDEVIYCDYEDDIFQRDLDKGASRFRQVKLYSSNFSFSREEIQKSLFNFFMLFVKADYKFDEVEFSFETNSGIAREVRGNDADLLREWAENQVTMSEKLKIDCREKVKGIIDEYIAADFNKNVSDGNRAEFEKAREIYEELSDETWDIFIASIRWKFEVVSQDEAIPLLLSKITKLIPDLPLSIDPEKATTYISLLHFEIANRTAQSNEEDKKLTNDLLDIILLTSGSEENRWYGETYAKWSNIAEIKYFNVGAFYEVVSAARHCRWELDESGHHTLWLSLLEEYINLADITLACRRKAIYEFLFLTFSPNSETGLPREMIAGHEDWIRFYFNELEHRNSFADFKEDIFLLQSIEGILSIDSNTSLMQAEIEEWKKMIEYFIDEKINTPRNNDELCLAYEIKGDFIFNFNRTTPLNKNVKTAIENYRQILPLLNEASTYSISGLSEYLTDILKILINEDVEDEVIDDIENFMNEIEEYAIKTGKQHNAAHNLAERGALYMEKGSLKNFVKALDCFHKAKKLWYLEDTKDGYILSLINIAQIYLALGMNLAAKYYGLCGVWASVHFGDYTVLKRVSDSYGVVFKADFQQGAWMSSLDDCKGYIFSRFEFKTDNPYDDGIFKELVNDLACILAATPILHPEMTAFIGFVKNDLKDIYTSYIQYSEEKLTAIFQKEESLNRILKGKLTSNPLNDVGAERKISFTASGIDWEIVFENTATLNAVSEGVGAIIQMLLCEISLFGYDYHFLQIPVTINVTLSTDDKPRLTQRPSHENSVWDLSIPPITSSKDAAIKLHNAHLIATLRILLSNISVLKTDEFNHAFDEMFKKNMIADKILGTNTYEKVYFNLLTEEEFNESRRGDFSSLNFSNQRISENTLELYDGFSEKYNNEQSLEHIRFRYESIQKRLSVSLSKWIAEPKFINLIKDLREQGWLDWQILFALQNYVLAAKVEINLRSSPETDPVKLNNLANNEFTRLFELDEKDCYTEIPVDWLQTELFNFYLQKTPTDVLESFGLQNGMKHPNFKGVHHFLNKRFNFNLDDISENNFLRNI